MILGVENGNNDQVAFIFVVAAVLAMARLTRRWVVAGGVLLLIAAVLKLFPIMAVGTLLRHGRRGMATTAAVLAAFGLYLLATIDDVRAIHRVEPATLYHHIYNLDQIGRWLQGRALSGSSHYVLDGIAALVGAAIAFTLGWALRPPAIEDPDRVRRSLDLDLFIAGASIYFGTYLYPAFRSFDYRLMFLLLTLPQLFRWLHARYVLAAPTILALLVSLWLERPFDNVRVVGWFLVRWNTLTSLGGPGSSLPSFAAAQWVLYVALLSCLVGHLLVRFRLTGSSASREGGSDR